MRSSIIVNTTGKRAILVLFLTLLAGAGFLVLWQVEQNAANTRPAQADFDGDNIGDFVLLRFPNNPPPAAAPINWYIYKSQGVAYTPPGSNVTVKGNEATVTFTQVGTTGNTTITPIAPPSSAGTAPGGYTILGAGPAVNITTTATFTPPVVTCLTASSVNNPTAFAGLRILHGEGGQMVDRTIVAPDPLAPDFPTRRICARTTTLSPFAVAFVTTTAAGVSVSGRVLTSDGRGVRSATVNITDQSGGVRSVTTGSRGTYTFADVEVGQTYIISVSSQRFQYAPRVLQVFDNLAGLDLVPE